MLRRRLFVALIAAFAGGCSGGGVGSSSPGPTPSPAAFIEFVPASVTLRSSQVDYYGFLTYSARAGLVPKPVSPAGGWLACDHGFNVALQIHAGPAPIGVVHDEYIVFPLSVNPPKGTTLTCSSTWGLFDAAGTMAAQAPLRANLIYDTGKPAISFSPPVLVLKSTAPTATSVLAYESANGSTAEPIEPPSLDLACKGGYTLKPQIRAGGTLEGYVQDRFEIDPSAVTPKPKAGTKTISCATVWALLDAKGHIVQEAALAVVITYAAQ